MTVIVYNGFNIPNSIIKNREKISAGKLIDSPILSHSKTLTPVYARCILYQTQYTIQVGLHNDTSIDGIAYMY